MFIGHFGVGFGAKKAAPKISLGTLFLAVQFVDLLWPTFLLLGIERAALKPGTGNAQPLDFTYYPFTHSLLMGIVWAILFGGCYLLFKKDRRGALILALCVLSHWVLDLIVHLPDLPLYPGGSIKVGFGLWNYPIATAIIEGAIFLGGMMVYLRTTSAKNAIGRIGVWVLILLLVVSHVGNMVSPPPTSVTAVAWEAQFIWLFVLLAYWVDRNRTVRS